jgi:hypothetical protein
MKKSLLTIALAGATLVTYGQGQIDFRNNNLVAPPDRLVRAGTGQLPSPGGTGLNQNRPGEGLVGTTFIAQLFFASDASNLDAQPAILGTDVHRFRASTTTLPGTWSGGTRVLRGVLLGETANLVVRVWDSAFASYGDAVRGNGALGQSAPFAYTVPTSPTPPPTDLFMNNFAGFTVNQVPEPSTIALGLLGGLGTMLLFRRRK